VYYLVIGHSDQTDEKNHYVRNAQFYRLKAFKFKLCAQPLKNNEVDFTANEGDGAKMQIEIAPGENNFTTVSKTTAI
jgi:hypothetical protein